MPIRTLPTTAKSPSEHDVSLGIVLVGAYPARRDTYLRNTSIVKYPELATAIAAACLKGGTVNPRSALQGRICVADYGRYCREHYTSPAPIQYILRCNCPRTFSLAQLLSRPFRPPPPKLRLQDPVQTETRPLILTRKPSEKTPIRKIEKRYQDGRKNHGAIETTRCRAKAETVKNQSLARRVYLMILLTLCQRCWPPPCPFHCRR